ncbi:MAG TPA: ROK family protein [Polyangiaceae bacterium]|jgi:polyphosphate glucokinase|nr:ROK family protein [Polyangiaceae bacterium]
MAVRRRSVFAGPATSGRGRPYTLAIDIGGTGLKALVLDRAGAAVKERVRVDTPRPATPAAVLSGLAALVHTLGSFDRVSVGFPGVVVRGVVKTAPNLHKTWANVKLAEKLAKVLGAPTRVLNDAGVQGLGLIEGEGLEMVLTLGTGMGCALFYEGTYIPNLELAHAPFKKGRTFEDYVGNAALEAHGKKKWNRHVAEVIATIDPVWNPDRIYLGGGNVKHLKLEASPHVRIGSNAAGLLGGIALWEGREGLALDKIEKATRGR